MSQARTLCALCAWAVRHTEPELLVHLTEPLSVRRPVAIERDRAVLASLEDLPVQTSQFNIIVQDIVMRLRISNSMNPENCE